MRHLLLLLPFLLFDLLFDEVNDHNEKYGTNHSSPANDLIALVLVLLEWYRLYRCHQSRTCIVESNLHIVHNQP